MSNAFIIRPGRKETHECDLPAAREALAGAVALCPVCGTWWTCKSWYVEHMGPAVGWNRQAQALIHNGRKYTK